MVAPTILGLMILNIIPFFQTIYMSFSNHPGGVSLTNDLEDTE